MSPYLPVLYFAMVTLQCQLGLERTSSGQNPRPHRHCWAKIKQPDDFHGMLFAMPVHTLLLVFTGFFSSAIVTLARQTKSEKTSNQVHF